MREGTWELVGDVRRMRRKNKVWSYLVQICTCFFMWRGLEKIKI